VQALIETALKFELKKSPFNSFSILKPIAVFLCHNDGMNNQTTKNKKPIRFYMRVIHRYLGFFLAGIMSVYALSGILLIYRQTDFLKSEQQIEKQISLHILSSENLGKALKIRNLKITKKGADGTLLYFKEGNYNTQTGVAKYTVKELPFVLSKLNDLHKSSTKKPLYILNIFFALSLLFFALSSFWMFMPQTKIFRKGLYFTLGGIILTLILIFV